MFTTLKKIKAKLIFSFVIKNIKRMVLPYSKQTVTICSVVSLQMIHFLFHMMVTNKIKSADMLNT